MRSNCFACGSSRLTVEGSRIVRCESCGRDQPALEDFDYAAIEARILAAVAAGTIAPDVEPPPADPAERDRWKARNFTKLYGTTGRIKDLLK